MLTIKAEYIKSLKHRFRLVSSLLSVMLCMGFTANAFAVNFSAVSTFQLSNTSPKDVELTDLDGDGFPDMIFTMSGARSGDASIDIYYGDSVGGLNNGAITQLNYSPENVTVGDFNNDGVNDIAVSATSLNSPGVRVYIQGRNVQLKGNRVFSLAPIIILPSTFPDGIVNSDFDGDGLVDLVVNTINSGMFFALGNGDGTFSTMTAVTNTVGLQGRDLAIADFNNDLLLDLATPIGIFLGSNTGNFIKSAVQGGGVAIATGDLNNDGNIDTVSTGSDAIVISLGNGDGTFNALPIIFATNASFKDVVIADINVDGFQDLIITKQIPNTGDVQGSVEVYLGLGDGTFDAVLSYPVGINPEPLAIGDINSDGFLDFVSGNDDPLQTNATFALQIQTTPPANIAPVASSLNLSTIERTPIAFTLFARDANKDPLTFSYSLPQSGGTLTGTAPDLIYTAPAGFAGTDTFTFTAQDPSLAVSNVATVSITVTIPNTAPVITSQSVISTNEDNDLIFTTSGFTIVDQEDLAFTLRLLPPATNANYTVFGNRLTPAKNFSGILSVPLVVNDGTVDSAVFNAIVTINPVNDAPVITGQKPLATQEENALLLSLADLVVTDVDSSAFTMNVLAPATNANYTVTGKTITPKLNYNGTLKVSVRVSDGTDNSAIFNASVTVTAVNDAPVITGQQPLSTLEDQALTLSIADLIITDVDNAGGFALSVLQPAVGANYTVLGNTITPAAFFNGQLSVSVQVDDGNTNSNVFLLVISVIPVNTAPVITGQVQLNGKEDTNFTLQVSDFSISDVDSNAFTLSLLAPASGSNYTAVGTTITPAPNYNGSLVVPVRVSDGTDNSAIFNASVAIAAVNDAPVITGQKPLSTLEDQALTLSTADLIIADIDTVSGFSLSVLPAAAGANYTISGNTITPTAFFNGQLTVRVQINDGSANSNIFSLAISVTPVNNVPVITGQVPLSSNEDTSLTLKVSDFNINDPDSNAFTLSVVAPGSGANYTVVGATVTPVANYNGLLTVPVTVKDETNSSATFNASVTITAVNDAPVITGQKPLSTLEDQTLTLSIADLTVTDIDTVSGFSLSVLPPAAGANYTVLGNTITPTAFFNGQLSVRVQVNDGSANSNIFSLIVNVTSVNNEPVITGQGLLSSQEDTALTLQVSDFTIADPDSNAFTLSVLAPLATANYTVQGTKITPKLNYNGTLVVPVMISDGTNNSATFNATVNITAVNDAPVANAGINQTAIAGDVITLDGSGSTDADGNALLYYWVVTNKPIGSTLILSDNSAMNPTATVELPGVYSLVLYVFDGFVVSDFAEVSVTVSVNTSNTAPIADSKVITTDEDLAVAIVLSGSDAEQNPLSYVIVNQPLHGTIEGVSPNLTYTPFVDYNGVDSFTYKTSDGALDSIVADVSITVKPVNDAPVANAGANKTVFVGDTITLDGSGSTDVDGNQLIYYWIPTSKPAGSTLFLSNVSVVNPSVTIDLPGVYTFILYVYDGFVVGSTDTVVFTTANSAPVADAGPNQSVLVGSDVVLSASGSTDIDGNPLTYSWTLASVPTASAAVLSDTLAINPTFNADFPGIYAAELIVNDGSVDSDPVTVTISTINSAPIANPGADQSVFTGDLVILDGSASSDVDGNALTYRWAFTSTPVDSIAALSNSLGISPTFTVDFPGTYVAQLIVNDGTIDSAPITVSITTSNSAPVANPGADQSVFSGDIVILDGSASSDADNDTLSYSWSLTTPVGSSANLSDQFAISPTFTVDVSGTYVAQLIVNDGSVDSAPVNVLVTTSNTNAAPISNPGVDQSVFTGDLVTLDGGASSDADNDLLDYRWSLTAPAGSSASFSDQFAVSPTFIADVAGTYVAQLIVNDGVIDSLPVTVTITVIDPVNVNIWSLMWKSGDQELIMKGDSGSANLEITYTSNAAPIMTINNGGGGEFEDKAQLSIAPCAITVSTSSGFVLLDNIAVSGASANDCQ